MSREPALVVAFWQLTSLKKAAHLPVAPQPLLLYESMFPVANRIKKSRFLECAA